MITTCLTDSAKLVPYIAGNRKIVKAYLKTCLGFWSSPSIDSSKDEEGEVDTGEEDRVRIAAFLSIRRVAMANDEALLDLVLKVRLPLLDYTLLTNVGTGCLYNTHPDVPSDQRTFITSHQSDEEYCRRAVCD